MARRGETSGPVEVRMPGFGGLDLGDTPRGSRPNGAQEAMDIILAGQDSIRPRRGSERYLDPVYLTDAVTPIDLFVFNVYGLPVAVWGGENELAWAVGVTEGVAAGLAVGRLWYDLARIGTPGLQQAFIGAASISGFAVDGTPVQLFDTSSGMTVPAATVSGGAPSGDLGDASVLGTWEADARLLMGGYARNPGSYGPGGATVDQDTIVVSNPAAPTSFGTVTNPGVPTFRVGAGDGELVKGIVNFRDMTFIFKETRAWVLTGISAGPTGAPEFLSLIHI